MSQYVSVPEKTLEHWSSQYVTYRYKSQAALWWPTSGEDIKVDLLPPRPGKAVQLELKTTTPAGAAFHDVWVDLGQLWTYCQRPLGHQPFYVFPQPEWRGNLAAVAKANGRSVTEMAFARSGSPWWFADWMKVLPTARVAAVLHRKLAAHRSRARKKVRLVRFDLSKSAVQPRIRWGDTRVSFPVLGWREFWSELEQCGLPRWPQLIRLPARSVQSQHAYSPSQVAGMLREAAATLAQGLGNDAEPLVTLEPDENGNYRIAPALVDDLSGSSDDQTDQVDDHRQIVFLDAGALR